MPNRGFFDTERKRDTDGREQMEWTKKAKGNDAGGKQDRKKGSEE